MHRGIRHVQRGRVPSRFRIGSYAVCPCPLLALHDASQTSILAIPALRSGEAGRTATSQSLHMPLQMLNPEHSPLDLGQPAYGTLVMQLLAQRTLIGLGVLELLAGRP